MGDLFLLDDLGQEGPEIVRKEIGYCSPKSYPRYRTLLSSYRSTMMAVKRISIETIETNRRSDLFLSLAIRIFPCRAGDVRAGCLSIRRIVVKDKKARRREG